MKNERRSGSDRRKRDIGPPPGLADLFDEALLLKVASKAVKLYAESKPRPSQVTQDQAAEMLGVSRATVSRMVKAGQLKLNGAGRLSIASIDKLLEAP